MRPSRLRSGAVLALLLGLPLLAPATQDAEWKLERDEDGIQVWTQAVPGSEIPRFRGRTVVNAGLAEIRDVLTDVPRMAKWFPDCVEARTLSKEGDIELRYVVTDAPWPVDDRDAIYHIETNRLPSGEVRIAMNARPDTLPPQEGRVRVQKAQGGWHLEPGNGGTAVTWELHLEPGGSVPSWLTKQRVVETPFKALRELRAQAETKGS